MKEFLGIILYIVFAPLVGGFLAGIDRKVTARLQGRVGPPVWQPFFDVLKLFQKENLVVRKSQDFYIFFYLIFILFTGSLFFGGENLLLVIFAMTLADIFFVLGAYKASSPYSFAGAQRELIQIMSYEPALLFAAAGMYMVTKSFYVHDIGAFSRPLIIYLPAVFIAFFYVLEIKFRKSPFDLSTSHHAHQELVKGVTTEFSGPTLAMIEMAHWYENILILGFVYLFFAYSIWSAIVVTLAVYFAAIFIDNIVARVRWQMTLGSCWLVALVFGMGNIIVLFFLERLCRS